MAGAEVDRAEVDRLVKELASRRRIQKPAAGGGPTAPARPAAASGAATSTTSPHAADYPPPAPGRWTSARLLMPAARTAEPRNPLAFASAMRLPALPRPSFSLPELTDLQWSVLTARLFVGLGLALAAAMPFWPYANTCSWGLMLYLSAVLLVVVTGVWGAKLTWDARLGAAHTLALCVVFWGVTFVTAEVLPRVGYAQVQEPWICPW